MQRGFSSWHPVVSHILSRAPTPHWTLYQYDADGRVTREIRNAANTAYYSGNWQNLYSYGLLSSSSDRDLGKTTSYDALGRVRIVSDDRTGNVDYTGYDQLGRTVITVKNYIAYDISDPVNWIWNLTPAPVPTPARWENGGGVAINHGTAKDTNLISMTKFDVMGRVISTWANDGAETRHELDKSGRVIRQIENYVDGAYSATAPDVDRITSNTYNKAGYLLSTTDPRGVVTSYTYDKVGRKIITTIAPGTAEETATYTCYNKAGDVLRVIQNYIPVSGKDPDTRTSASAWDLNSSNAPHGADNDQNLITEFCYDKAGRQVLVIDPNNYETWQYYDKAGQVIGKKDALNIETLFFYDAMRRLTKVVQAYQAQTNAPANWLWSTSANRWDDGAGNAIGHGTDNARNLIVTIGYDKAGRMTARREPRGNLTQYTYDRIDRRLTQVSPLNLTWETQYSNLANGRSKESAIYPGLNGSLTSYTVQREFDRAGRLDKITYGDAATTPNVVITYTVAGQRALVTENGTSSTIRFTEYLYDNMMYPENWTVK